MRSRSISVSRCGARHGVAWRGKAWRGLAGLGKGGCGTSGAITFKPDVLTLAWRGTARQGPARPGRAWQGKARTRSTSVHTMRSRSIRVVQRKELTMKYDEFLAKKHFSAPSVGITEHSQVSDKLFHFQRQIVEWALRKGRASLFADTGLGKGWMTLEWLRIVQAETGKPVILLAPLAVSRQFEREAKKLGTSVHIVNDGSEVVNGINVTNYQKLHKFDDVDFMAVALDESSILKNMDGSTRKHLTERFRETPYRLCATATPSPNDHTELGGHADFLGIMSQSEMLATFFVHDGSSTQDWRLKGHARKDFWDWVASWAVTLKRPSDLGFSDDGYILPPLNVIEHVIPASFDSIKGTGMLFASEAKTLNEQRGARRASMSDRVSRVVDIANATNGPVVVWCDLNAEGDALESAIKDAIQISGSDDDESKERKLIDFSEGRSRVLVTKPSVAGFGLNWQHCSTVVFCGVTHSFEQYYQSVRRCYRFGQANQVNVHVVTSELEGRVVENLKRKQQDADNMAIEMVRAMAEQSKKEIRSTSRIVDVYNASRNMTIPSWLEAS